MLDIVIHKPIQKKGYFFSRVTTNDKQPIKLRIPYSVIKHHLLLSNKHGYLFDIQVPDNDFAMDTIAFMENECVNEVIKQNSNWFSNALNENTINSMLESVIRNKNCLQIYSSNIRSSALFKGDFISISDWLEKLQNEVTITIMCDGMFIYPTKFGLRWVISEMKECDTQSDEILPDIGELENYWKSQSKQYLEQLTDEQNIIGKKISELNDILQSFGNNSIDIDNLDSNIVKLKKLMNERHFYKNILSEIDIV